MKLHERFVVEEARRRRKRKAKPSAKFDVNSEAGTPRQQLVAAMEALSGILTKVVKSIPADDPDTPMSASQVFSHIKPHAREIFQRNSTFASLYSRLKRAK